MADRVAYILNQYPSVSHSFIRTEMLALEQQGFVVDRIAMRGWNATLVDPLDLEERRRTRYVLAVGAVRITLAVLATIFGRPLRFAQALRTAWRLGRGGERSSLFHLIYLAEACVARRWVDAAGSCHVHAHFGSNAATVAMLVRTLGGPPFSFTVHGPEEFDKPLQLKLRDKIAAAKAVVAISSFGRSQLYRWSNIDDWPKIAVVHCALDPRFRETRAAPPADPGSLVCVGRLCEQKGQLLLIDAIARLRDAGHDVRLTLAGDGEMRAPIETAVARAGLTDRVRITGWLSAAEVRTAIEAASAFVLPSFAEGLPVAIMEAMALGRPIVSTTIAGIPELVREGTDGRLVAPGDAEALAAAIAQQLAVPPSHRLAQSQDSIARVLARHDATVEAAKLATLFRVN